MKSFSKQLQSFKGLVNNEVTQFINEQVALIYLKLQSEVKVWSDTGRTYESISIRFDENFVTPNEGQHRLTNETKDQIIKTLPSTIQPVYYIGASVPYLFTLEYGNEAQTPKALFRHTLNNFKG